jgi:hypothetical protein
MITAIIADTSGLEIDEQGKYLPSATSNTVGFCFDHGKYQLARLCIPSDLRTARRARVDVRRAVATTLCPR